MLKLRLLLLAVLLVCCAGCGDPVTIPLADDPALVAVPSDGVPPTAFATAPATLVALVPAVVQAGSGGATVTLVVTGIGAGAVVEVDGVAHAATLLSSTRAAVVFAPGQLTSGTRHSIAIQNHGQAASNAATLLVTGGYWAFGDSITAGLGLPDPAAQNYAHLLSNTYRLTLINSAYSGDQACDLWPHLFRSRAGYTAVAAPLFSVTIGTNDVNAHGITPYEAVYSRCALAALAWLGTPRVNKVLPGDAALAAGGACSGAANDNALGAATCTGLPGTVTATLTTSGAPIYVWYLLSDDAATGDGIDVTLDSVGAGAAATLTAPLIETRNGGRQGMGVLRMAAAAGTHTVSIRTTGRAGILGVGSNPASGADRPRLLVGDLPNQAINGPVAPVASQLAYLADQQAINQQVLADGIDLHRARTRDYMLGTVSEMADQLHPNLLGQQHLLSAFRAALP